MTETAGDRARARRSLVPRWHTKSCVASPQPAAGGLLLSVIPREMIARMH